MKWKRLFNFDVLAIIVVIVSIVYVHIKYGIKFKKHKVKSLLPGDIKKNILKNPKKKKHNKHEEKCREIFEEIYGYTFKSIRPNWLKNPSTGRNLELDGYCEHIRTPLGKGLAFEYDGRQHSHYTPHFHKNHNDFIYQTKKDEYKDLKCKEKGVFLVRIPHFVTYDNLKEYIRDKLTRLKLLPRGSNSYHGIPTPMSMLQGTIMENPISTGYSSIPLSGLYN